MGDCVHVYGVLLMGVLSRWVVWLMLYVFNQAMFPLRGEEEKEKKLQKLKK